MCGYLRFELRLNDWTASAASEQLREFILTEYREVEKSIRQEKEKLVEEKELIITEIQDSGIERITVQTSEPLIP